jgi:hypothetical protein
MSLFHRRWRPVLELLELRLAMSGAHGLQLPSETSTSKVHSDSVHTAKLSPTTTLQALTGFTRAYPSKKGQKNFNPAYDVNHNNQVGQTDGHILLDNLPPLSKKIPLVLNVALAPIDRVAGPVPQNSGGVTYSKDPLVIGHTTPGALIYTGTGTLDFKLRGKAVVADAQGNFSFKVELTNGINSLALQAVDAYGQHTLRAFPILWLGFAKYESEHPTND